jgi:hypothetical protein
LVVVVTMMIAAGSTTGASGAPGDEEWTRRYDRAGLEDAGFEVVTSSDGTRAYVGGWASTPDTGNDFLTVAYDAATGERVWKKHFTGTGEGRDTILGIALSPDDGVLFVTGTSEAPNGQTHIRTIAYEAASGLVRWSQKFRDVVGNPRAIAASPDGSAVFVTGSSMGADGRRQMVTIAYQAANGRQEWVAGYDGVGVRTDFGVALAVGPSSTRVFVTGIRAGGPDQTDYVSIAYRTSDGSAVWTRIYNGPASGPDDPSALALSSDGAKVFVTGRSKAETHDYATVAYDAGSGDTLWVRRYDGMAQGDDSFDVASIGNAVFVTGRSIGISTSYDVATVAYDASTGRRLWGDRYDGPDGGFDGGTALATSPDGGTIFVAGGASSGGTSDFLTIAYAADSGQELWDAQYDGPAGVIDYALDVATDPLGSRIFVTGTSWTGATSMTGDVATISYET